ncbi:hypothetical protein HYH03_011258 [Edaphochlamys debaryana]|uniref:Reticulon-like protein n=1 Tax=Edaphochlamys debaryana TaxID=47281 RepID=A0A835XSC7_9CHLO|nr:hypothetical protein HYH03_011258 [Edaphochlamys debaryana]|eukprot:KAG2490307.1 hypothetical protein HYH03_011258 [Edaphochlamys debaryana]
MEDSPIDSLKQAATEMKTAFGSPHPDPVPEAPAVSGTPEVNPAKQLNFSLNSNTPATPATPSMVPALSSPSEELDYDTFIRETLLWKNKVRSAFYFVAGLLAWLVVRGIFTSPTTLFTGVCYTLLFSLAFNFLRGTLAPKLQERCTWSNSAVTRFVVAASSTAVSAAAELHDRHLNGLDPLRTLEVGLGLWLLSLLGRWLDAVTLLLLLHLGAFTLPAAYAANKARVDALAKDAYAKAQAQYEKLDRRVRATVVLAPMAGLLFALPLLDRLVVVFIMLAYGRVWAKPHEYAAVQKRLGPVGATLSKTVVTPLSTAAASAMARYDITPTPAKKKIN